MSKDPLRNVYTAKEAEEKYNLKPGTVRASCIRGNLQKFIGEGVKKSGATWLITKEVMDQVYTKKQ